MTLSLKQPGSNRSELKHDASLSSSAFNFKLRRCILALAKPGAQNTFSIHRPNTGVSFFDMDIDELKQKYTQVKDEDGAREAWEATYQLTERGCMHGPSCSAGERGRACSAGSRAVRCCILSGAVVPAW
jgi:hypothetical protein